MLTKQIRYALGQLLTSIPIGEQQRHGWEETSSRKGSQHLISREYFNPHSPFEETQKETADTKARKVLDKATTQAHNTP